MRWGYMDNDGDVGFWDTPKVSWFAEISLTSPARVSPIVAGKFLKLLSWQGNRYFVRVFFLSPLFNARQKKNNVNKWSILDFTKEGSVIHIVICMCRADIDISHLLQQSSLYLLGGSLTEPKAHRLSESRSSVCPGDQLSLPPNF